MGERVSAVVGDLRDASKDAGDLASDVGELTPGTPLRDAAAAVPGASSVSVLGHVASQWEQDLSTWRTTMDALGARLDIAATNYESTDGRNASAYPGRTPLADLAGPPNRLPISP